MSDYTFHDYKMTFHLDSMLFLAWRDTSVDEVVYASSGCV